MVADFVGSAQTRNSMLVDLSFFLNCYDLYCVVCIGSLMPGALSVCQAHRGLPVGFLLL